MDFKSNVIVSLPEPKGFGTISKNEEEICTFTNHITLFGKINILNAILRNCQGENTPTIPKIIGLS